MDPEIYEIIRLFLSKPKKLYRDPKAWTKLPLTSRNTVNKSALQDLAKDCLLDEYGAITKHNKLVVPKPAVRFVVYTCHDATFHKTKPSEVMHFSPGDTLYIAKSTFCWPSLQADVLHYCQSCIHCKGFPIHSIITMVSNSYKCPDKFVSHHRAQTELWPMDKRLWYRCFENRKKFLLSKGYLDLHNNPKYDDCRSEESMQETECKVYAVKDSQIPSILSELQKQCQHLTSVEDDADVASTCFSSGFSEEEDTDFSYSDSDSSTIISIRCKTNESSNPVFQSDCESIDSTSEEVEAIQQGFILKPDEQHIAELKSSDEPRDLYGCKSIRKLRYEPAATASEETATAIQQIAAASEQTAAASEETATTSELEAECVAINPECEKAAVSKIEAGNTACELNELLKVSADTCALNESFTADPSKIINNSTTEDSEHEVTRRCEPNLSVISPAEDGSLSVVRNTATDQPDGKFTATGCTDVGQSSDDNKEYLSSFSHLEGKFDGAMNSFGHQNISDKASESIEEYLQNGGLAKGSSSKSIKCSGSNCIVPPLDDPSTINNEPQGNDDSEHKKMDASSGMFVCKVCHINHPTVCHPETTVFRYFCIPNRSSRSVADIRAQLSDNLQHKIKKNFSLFFGGQESKTIKSSDMSVAVVEETFLGHFQLILMPYLEKFNKRVFMDIVSHVRFNTTPYQTGATANFPPREDEEFDRKEWSIPYERFGNAIKCRHLEYTILSAFRDGILPGDFGPLAPHVVQQFSDCVIVMVEMADISGIPKDDDVPDRCFFFVIVRPFHLNFCYPKPKSESNPVESMLDVTMMWSAKRKTKVAFVTPVADEFLSNSFTSFCEQHQFLHVFLPDSYRAFNISTCAKKIFNDIHAGIVQKLSLELLKNIMSAMTVIFNRTYQSSMNFIPQHQMKKTGLI